MRGQLELMEGCSIAWSKTISFEVVRVSPIRFIWVDYRTAQDVRQWAKAWSEG